MKRKVIMLVLLLISSTLTVWALSLPKAKAKKTSDETVTASPGTIWVPDNYSKIQWAIGNASDGDTIRVRTGTYDEHLTIDKSLTLIGEDPKSTIIDARAQPPGIKYVLEIYNTSYVYIGGFTMMGRGRGIGLANSTGGFVSGNIVTNNSQYGIFLVGCNDITISGNEVSNNGDRGIYLRYSNNINVTGNTISHHNEMGILLFSSEDNVIVGNTISHINQYGILCGQAMGGSENNTFVDNTIFNSTYGITLRDSPHCILRNNNMTGSTYNFDLAASGFTDYIQDVDTSNTVNGKPIYYWVNRHDVQVPSDAGYVAVINSTNVTVKDLNLTNNKQGVLFAKTSGSIIENVNASYNKMGIDLFISSNNHINNNFLANNSRGIQLYDSSDNTIMANIMKNNEQLSIFSMLSGNTIFGNSFINENRTMREFFDWAIPTNMEGNYWSDYNGTDADQDGIGDTPYIIYGDNKDNYPLMGMFSDFAVVWAGETYHVTTISNSTITNFQFELMNNTYQGTISFNVTGPPGTTGFCRVMIPKSLMNSPEGLDNWRILVNGTDASSLCNKWENNTHTFIYIPYNHSTQKVEILSTWAVPEFPSAVILLLLMILTLIVTMVRKDVACKGLQ